MTFLTCVLTVVFGGLTELPLLPSALHVSSVRVIGGAALAVATEPGQPGTTLWRLRPPAEPERLEHFDGEGSLLVDEASGVAFVFDESQSRTMRLRFTPQGTSPRWGRLPALRPMVRAL